MRNLLTAFLLLTFLTGCVSGPDHQRPEIQMPEQWSESASANTSETALDSKWWTSYQDPTLTNLIEQALDRNPDIRIQHRRVEEFRSRLGFSRAEQYPTLGGQLGAARERMPGEGTYNQFSVSGLLGYELDVWGRLAREQEAAEALLTESEFARETVRLGIATDVAATYFQLRSAQRQRDITLETIASRAQSVELQEIRLKNGIIDELILEQARSEWETSRAELPLREQRVHTLEGALGILTGLSPAELWDLADWIADTSDPIHTPTPLPDFLPSELLERRPDIRAAEARLQAANARIGISKAQRLPRVNLAALLGTVSGSAGDLFASGSEQWRVGAEVAGPIWDFGRNRATVETAEARAAQSELLYQQTVIRAFNEVRDALFLQQSTREQLEATTRLRGSLERARDLAQKRYDAGSISYLELLDIQRALLAANLAREDSVQAHLTAGVTLIKALGGGHPE